MRAYVTEALPDSSALFKNASCNGRLRPCPQNQRRHEGIDYHSIEAVLFRARRNPLVADKEANIEAGARLHFDYSRPCAGTWTSSKVSRCKP
jgi:hypothetical protein